MMILATDLPVSSRQLRRIIRRCGVGLARTGSYLGHGSGEVMIGFTTANRIPMEGPSTLPLSILREDMLDIPFRAAAEATEEAVLNSLAAAHTVTGTPASSARRMSSVLSGLYTTSSTASSPGIFATSRLHTPTLGYIPAGVVLMTICAPLATASS